MSLSIELLENIIAIFPALLAMFLLCKKPRQIAGWAVSVLGSSAIAVVALGLLLKRLTAMCPGPLPTCEAPARALQRIPGIFSSCSSCSAEPVSRFTLMLNEIVLPLQAAVGIICIIISFVITIRFVLWAKSVLR